MNRERSSEVVEKYKQEKINNSVFARITSLLRKFDEDDRLDRKLAWIGVGILLGLVAISIYLFSKMEILKL